MDGLGNRSGNVPELWCEHQTVVLCAWLYTGNQIYTFMWLFPHTIIWIMLLLYRNTSTDLSLDLVIYVPSQLWRQCSVRDSVLFRTTNNHAVEKQDKTLTKAANIKFIHLTNTFFSLCMFVAWNHCFLPK